MKSRRACAIAILAVIVSQLCATAAAEPERAADAPLSPKCRLCGSRELELELGVPGWLPSVTGSFASGEADGGDNDFGERLRFDSALRFVMMGRLRMRAGPWGVLADMFGAQLAGDLGFSFAEGDIGHVDLAAGILRLAGSYQTPAVEFGDPQRPMLLRFVPYAGTRFYRIGASFERSGDPYEDKWKWWDPIVGVGVALDFRVGLVLRSEFDAGGFGAGNQIAWWFSSALEYGFTDWLALSLGWNFVRFEQDLGGGPDRLDMTLSLNGPVLALSFYMQSNRAQKGSPSVK